VPCSADFLILIFLPDANVADKIVGEIIKCLKDCYVTKPSVCRRLAHYTTDLQSRARHAVCSSTQPRLNSSGLDLEPCCVRHCLAIGCYQWCSVTYNCFSWSQWATG